MKKHENGFSSVATLAVLIVFGLVGATGWYVWHSKQSKNKITIVTTDKSTPSLPDEKKSDVYEGWKTYESVDKSLAFKYPGSWFIRHDNDLPRVYVGTSNNSVTKEDLPPDFQQIWFTSGSEEASQANEDSVKSGAPNGRMINGAIASSVIKSGDLVISVYEYNTVGGKTIQAFWTGKSGQRYYATNSTEVGEVNQQNMVDNLRKILASVVCK